MIHEISTFPRDTLPAFTQHFLTEDMLLFDIETTGLSPARSPIYCIGCGYPSGQDICVELFFAESAEEEPEVMDAFFRLAVTRPDILTFNGATFDIPFLTQRSGRGFPENTNHTDLYRVVRRMNNLLELPSCRQKSVEQFLGCEREDRYSGGELIEFYQKYTRSRDPALLDPILLHNREDVRGMFDLIGILSYLQFKDGRFEITDMLEEEDGPSRYLNIRLRPDLPLSQSIHQLREDASLLLGREEALLRIPIRHGTLKYFYDDPENYYYLPAEDTAVHKSVGQFVDSTHRIRATKKTCYSKKECDYLMLQINTAVSRLRTDYDAKGTYLEIPADAEKLKDILAAYFGQITG